MTLNSINLSGVSFKENSETKTDNATNVVKSDYEKTPKSDSFVKNETKMSAQENTTDTVQQAGQENIQKKKKNRIRNIIIGAVALPVVIYGAIVLKHKLSKSTFEEIHQCFKEIFSKDLSKEEVNNLLSEYKKLFKNENTEDFAKQMIERLKKDYGIEQVKTELTVTKLADSKISTALNQRESGNASPLAKINIMPNTHSDDLIRHTQGEVFATGIHEIKHLKQFAEAYRANPDKFAEVLFRQNVKPEEIEKRTQEAIKVYTDSFTKTAKLLKNGDEKIIEEIIKVTPELKNFDKNEVKTELMQMDIKEIIRILKEQDGHKTEEELYAFWKKETEDSFIKVYRKALDDRYGELPKFKEGSDEYKKGMEYIEAYEKYPDPDKDYEAYKANLLEKEAWHNGDLSKKIYNYLKSIWSL